VNQTAPSGFRYLKLTLGGGSARMTLNAQDLAGVMAALQGAQVAPGHNLVVQLGASAGRNLSNAERETLRSAIRSAYDASHKALNLAALAQTHSLAFANFQNSTFTTELFNAIHAAAGDAVSINFAQNQIQSLTTFAGLLRVVPHLQNLSLQNNYIAKSAQHHHHPAPSAGAVTRGARQPVRNANDPSAAFSLSSLCLLCHCFPHAPPSSAWTSWSI